MKKSRSNSAFFVLCRGVLIGAILACLVFLMEVFALGLMPVIDSELRNPQLWIVPGLVFLFVFVWCLSRNGVFRTILVLLMVGSLAAGLYYQGPALLSSLMNVLFKTRIDLQRYNQLDDPEFENTFLLANHPFPIYYVDDGNLDETIDQSTLEALTAYISQLPPVLLENCTGIYLMEDQAFTTLDDSYEDSSVYGVSKSQNFTVDIRLIGNEGRYSYTYLHSGKAVTLDDPLFYTETIVHELVHLVDMKHGTGSGLLSASDQVQQFYADAPDLFGDYGASSATEWFAEAGVYYFLYPQTLYSLSPNVYTYMEGIFT